MRRRHKKKRNDEDQINNFLRIQPKAQIQIEIRKKAFGALVGWAGKSFSWRIKQEGRLREE